MLNDDDNNNILYNNNDNLLYITNTTGMAHPRMGRRSMAPCISMIIIMHHIDNNK